jgi:hypothetical protein
VFDTAEKGYKMSEVRTHEGVHETVLAYWGDYLPLRPRMKGTHSTSTALKIPDNGTTLRRAKVTVYTGKAPGSE